jgi:hypothetical protein
MRLDLVPVIAEEAEGLRRAATGLFFLRRSGQKIHEGTPPKTCSFPLRRVKAQSAGFGPKGSISSHGRKTCDPPVANKEKFSTLLSLPKKYWWFYRIL